MGADLNRSRPNIIVVISHDTGRHFGCYGVPSVNTPAIDALAADGVRFTSMFATAAMCTPSRGSLFTGKYPECNGLMGLAGAAYRYEMNNPREHLSFLLHDAGYRTMLFGHQHEALNTTTLGFDQWINPPAGSKDREGAVATASEVASYLAKRRADDPQPFYLQIGFIETHTPYLALGGEPDTSKGVWLPPYAGADEGALHKHLANFQGSIRQVDRAVATILEAIRAAGVEKNTLFLFTVDHGPELPRAKWTGFDAGAQVAAILRWSDGKLHGGRTCDLLLNNTDILPTLMDLAGLPAPTGLDGINFAEALRHPDKVTPEVRDEVFFSFFYSQIHAVRTRSHKFIRYFNGGCFNYSKFLQYHMTPAYELYDVQADPGEFRNLAQDPAYASVLEEMNGRLWRHLERVKAPVLNGPVTYRPYLLAMEAYQCRRGRWTADLSDVLERSGDGATYTIATAKYRLQREFTSIYMERSLRLFDRVADPESKTNLVMNPACADVLTEMDAKLWTWLEREKAPILTGLPSVPAIDQALEDYHQWRSR